MKLTILSKELVKQNKSYRGTDRTSPGYCEDVDKDHLANQAFFWYCQSGDEDGIVHDLGQAQRLVSIYQQLNPPQYFEVVELVLPKEQPIVGNEFLGFDLSAEYHFSLLGWTLELDSNLTLDLVTNKDQQILLPLLTLIKKYFQPQLNANGLFDNYDTASFCLEVMMAVQKIHPGIWENDRVKFEVLGLWKV